MHENTVRSASARWVDAFLLPALHARFPGTLHSGLRCLQVEPADEEEATYLRSRGHACDVLLCNGERAGERAWQRPPLVGGPARLPVEDHRYDFVWSGAFGRLNRTPESRSACARELCRVSATGGAVMLTAGNRASPLDLSAGSARLHGPFRTDLVTLPEMKRHFVDEGGFSAMRLLSLEGCFGWAQLPGALRFAAAWLEGYLRWVSSPASPGIYGSPLNPMFALWFERAAGARA
jgi:hypothetical protein